MTDPHKSAVEIFVDRFPVLSETFVVSEAAALAALGHRVSVQARRRSDDPEASVPPGMEVHWIEDELGQSGSTRWSESS